MQRRFFFSMSSLALLVALVSPTMGAIVAQWNFNAQSNPSNASTGVGTTTGFGSGLAFAFTPNQTGSPGDLNPVLIGAGLNNNAAVRSAAAIGSASGIRGIDIKTSLVGYNTPTISWHQLGGFRTSRYYQILATSDGINYAPVPVGTGSSATVLGSGTQLSLSATVSNTGLVDIRTSDGLIPAATNGGAFVYPLSFTFPTGTVYDNNPNFGVRIVSVWDPNGTTYVSSFAGTTSADATKGYSTTTTAGGGSIRYDLITVTAVPEASTILCLSFASVATFVVHRVRSRRSVL
jgi:hypothetical protein